MVPGPRVVNILCSILKNTSRRIKRPARPTWDGEGGAVPPVEMLLNGVQGGIVQLLLEGGEARLVLGDVVDHRHHRAHRILQHQLNTQPAY